MTLPRSAGPLLKNKTLLRWAGSLMIIMTLLRSAGPRVGQGLPLSRTARASSRLGRLRLKMRDLARK